MVSIITPLKSNLAIVTDQIMMDLEFSGACDQWSVEFCFSSVRFANSARFAAVHLATRSEHLFWNRRHVQNEFSSFNPIPGGGGKFTRPAVYSIFGIEDAIFLPPLFLTFNFYLYYAFCESLKSIPCVEKKLWVFCRT